VCSNGSNEPCIMVIMVVIGSNIRVNNSSNE